MCGAWVDEFGSKYPFPTLFDVNYPFFASIFVFDLIARETEVYAMLGVRFNFSKTSLLCDIVAHAGMHACILPPLQMMQKLSAPGILMVRRESQTRLSHS